MTATTYDQFAWTCGYYVTYLWQGEDPVFFTITTAGSMFIKATGILIILS